MANLTFQVLNGVLKKLRDMLDGSYAEVVAAVTIDPDGNVVTPTTGLATGQVSVDTTVGGKQIVAARPGRLGVLIVNEAATAVRIGPAGVTTATGALLAGVIGQTLAIDGAAAVYGIVASGTVAVSYVETF